MLIMHSVSFKSSVHIVSLLGSDQSKSHNRLCRSGTSVCLIIHLIYFIYCKSGSFYTIIVFRHSIYTMTSDNLFVNNCCHRRTVKTLCTYFPMLNIISTYAFHIFCFYYSAFVITTQEENILRIFNIVIYQLAYQHDIIYGDFLQREYYHIFSTALRVPKVWSATKVFF